MIGVIAHPSDYVVVQEFFELFKTPWEFYRKGEPYDVLLCTQSCDFEDYPATVTLIYGGRKLPFDAEANVQIAASATGSGTLSYKGLSIAVYGTNVTFRGDKDNWMAHQESQEPMLYVRQFPGRVTVRVGYDLFSEVRSLLTLGQPVGNAALPVLELHIALLKELILGCGIPLVEIPPVPEGYRCIACLTHDVDHPSICNHKFDHTMFGFLYRAVFGSLGRLVRGEMPARGLVKNWVAALKLPFVYLGLAKDFWREFDVRYLELEHGLPSTFFIIPFKNSPGSDFRGPTAKFRAARYGAAEIADSIRELTSAGCEVGLHGIDAWCDSLQGHMEIEEIRRLTGQPEIGARIHWLYFDQNSPAALEQAEAVYDSTVGYTEAVGYRAGTTQVYKPLQATRLLELPLHAMDTALFDQDHMGLSPQQAAPLLQRLVDNAIQFGGCITTNWHDRSLAPERQWDRCYRNLIDDLETRGAWFSTAGQAVSWFRKRRSAVFERDRMEPGAVRVKIAAGSGDGLPGLRLRMHKPRGIGDQVSEEYVDTTLAETARVACGAK